MKKLLNQVTKHLTYANIMVTILAFGALGGTAYAAHSLSANSVGTKQIRKNAVKSSKVKNGSLTGVDIKSSTLGQVPKAGTANTANTATTAASATTATTAQNAKIANGLTPPEAVRIIGASGQPAFETGGANLSPGYDQAGFWKDRECVVHLQGFVTDTFGSGSTIFVLPAGYRPVSGDAYSVYANSNAAGAPDTGRVEVQDSGAVTITSDEANPANWSLAGITFRASGC